MLPIRSRRLQSRRSARRLPNSGEAFSSPSITVAPHDGGPRWGTFDRRDGDTGLIEPSRVVIASERDSENHAPRLAAPR